MGILKAGVAATSTKDKYYENYIERQISFE